GVGAFFLFKGKSPDTKSVSQQPSTPSAVVDLDLIPGNAEVFVMLRTGDMWNAELVKKGLAEVLKEVQPGTDPVAQMQQATGLTPTDVERVTILMTDVQKEIGWVLVSATKPFDRPKMTAVIFKGQQPQKVQHAGKTLDVEASSMPMPNPQRTALYFV